MSVLPELLLWEPVSVNFSCGTGRMECDVLRDLGPPPNMILNIPPPPVPPVLEEFVARMSSDVIQIHDGGVPPLSGVSGVMGGYSNPSSGGHNPPSCDLCHWATTNNVGFVELAQKGPLIDDTWFLVIISSCVAAALVAILLAIAAVKYRDGKLKPLSDVALAKKEKALGLERCEAVLYPGPPTMAPPMPPTDPRLVNTRALWAGLKPLDEKFYTVDHCQPVAQKQSHMDIIQNLEDKYDYKHYTAVNYSTLAPMYSSGREQKIVNPKQGTFENVGYVGGDENNGQSLAQNCGVSRAAYLLGGGGRTTLSRPPAIHQHHYEMVAPRNSPSSIRRQMSLDRNGRGAQLANNNMSSHSRHNTSQNTPTISGPTTMTGVRLPALNSRPGRYDLTAMANGKHTLTRTPTEETHEVRRAQVALDRSGAATTSLAPVSPIDHVYASPLTSPVI